MIIESVIPASDAVFRATQQARDSAPGPDGLPYSAWRATGRAGAIVLHDMLRALALGAKVHRSMTAALSAFLPKPGAGHAGPARSGEAMQPGDTRPIALKNIDTMILAPTSARALRHDLDEWINEPQRGFMTGRDGAANIADMDATARPLAWRASAHRTREQFQADLAGMPRADAKAAPRSIADTEWTKTSEPDPPQMPVLWLFDFAAACSLLRRMQMPSHWRTLVCATARRGSGPSSRSSRERER